jgi:hypothetical protein
MLFHVVSGENGMYHTIHTHLQLWPGNGAPKRNFRVA